MKNFFKVSVFCVAIFSFTILPTTNCFAAELASAEGNSYLTFLNEPPYVDIFTFEEGGDGFSMELLEESLPGTGTYTNLDILFRVEWISTDETTTYDLTGISIAGYMIFGWGEKTVASDDDEIWFVGILSSIFPD
jgi:hypothetical protein